MRALDFEKLYRAYYMKVYSYLMNIVKDSSAAEELTQNTFYKAMTCKSKFKNQSGEFTWLCAIAKNLAADEFRKKAEVSDLSDTLPDDSDFVQELDDKAQALKIHLILHRLDEPYKEVFQLRIFGELNFREIGQIFGKTENWARVTYYRAKLKIQERMDDND